MGHQLVPQAGSQSFRGEVFLSSLLVVTVTTSAAIVANVAAQSVAVSSSARFAVGDKVTVDTGGTQEVVQITAIVDATHISGIFTQAHASGVNVVKQGYQNVPLGIVQEFMWDDTIDLKELRGPKSRMAIAVTQSGAKISGSCKFASTNAQILAVLRGATLTTTTTNGKAVTKAARKGSDNIIPVAVELFDVDNESGPHAFFYTVIFEKLSNPQKLDDYTVWDVSFTCYPEVSTGNVYDVFYPGDQTQPFAAPANYTGDTGLTTDQSDYTNLAFAIAQPVE